MINNNGNIIPNYRLLPLKSKPIVNSSEKSFNFPIIKKRSKIKIIENKTTKANKQSISYNINISEIGMKRINPIIKTHIKIKFKNCNIDDTKFQMWLCYIFKYLIFKNRKYLIHRIILNLHKFYNLIKSVTIIQLKFKSYQIIKYLNNLRKSKIKILISFRSYINRHKSKKIIYIQSCFRRL